MWYNYPYHTGELWSPPSQTPCIAVDVDASLSRCRSDRRGASASSLPARFHHLLPVAESLVCPTSTLSACATIHGDIFFTEPLCTHLNPSLLLASTGYSFSSSLFRSLRATEPPRCSSQQSSSVSTLYNKLQFQASPRYLQQVS
jgi:hypothetical protein